MGFDSKVLFVLCDVEMWLFNIDVMFVFDMMGLMVQKVVLIDIQMKIEGLCNVVKCFYEIFVKLLMDGVCMVSKFVGGMSGVQICFGFVFYVINVNVGYLLFMKYVVNFWFY